MRTARARRAMPKGRKRTRYRNDDGGDDGNGSGDNHANSEDEAEFSDDDTSSSSDDHLQLSDGTEEDEGERPTGARRPSVSDRLKRVKTTYVVDRERSLEWMLQQVGNAEACIAAATDPDQPQPASLLCSLHGYQLAGLRWLTALHACGLSGILADEMGLGKTAQSIGMLAMIAERHANGKGHTASSASTSASALVPSSSAGAVVSRPPLFLVIAPLSTLSGWREQLAAFCPSLNVVQYTGSYEERAALRASAGLLGDTTSPAASAVGLGGGGGATVVLASYEPVQADAPELRKVRWAYCVIDEAHRLKVRR